MKKIPLIYITSPSFSGSTLLATLLSAHRDISSVSEMSGLIPEVELETYKCGCGELMCSCPFWQELNEKMNQIDSPFSLDNFQTKFIFGSNRFTQVLMCRSLKNNFLNSCRDSCLSCFPGYRNKLMRIRQRNLAFIQSALEISGKTIFLDATKDPIRMKYLSKIPELDLRILHLTRDPRANANSYKKNKKISIQKGAFYWQRIHRDILRICRSLPSIPKIHCRYEDLCSNPEEEMQRILEAFGFNGDKSLFDYGSPRHIIGNRMRLSEKFEIKHDESWREEISKDDQEEVLRMVKLLANQFGYSE